MHLCDEVLPEVTIRLWVLSFPFRIRYLLAYDAKHCATVWRILVRSILGWLRERAASAGISGGRSGAMRNERLETRRARTVLIEIVDPMGCPW